MKNSAAAAIMMTHPPTVKIVVPIPPVEGSSDKDVLGIFPLSIVVPPPFTEVVVLDVVEDVAEAIYAAT